MNEIDDVCRSQSKQWLAALAASLAMINVGDEEFWLMRSLKDLGSSGPASWNDNFPVWNGFFAAAISSIVGAILGAVLAEKFGRRRILLVTSFFTICQIFGSFTANCMLSYTTLILGETGLGMTRVVVPLFISEIVDDNIRGTLLMLQLPFFYVGKLVAVGIGNLVSAELVGVVSLILTSIFLITFIWLPETPYYLATKKRNDAATKSLAFYRGTESFATGTEIDEIMPNHGEGCHEKIQQLVRLTNRKALAIIIFLTIIKWSEQILDTESNVVHVAMKILVSNVHHAEIIAHSTSLITSFAIVFTIDSIGRRSFLSYSTFLSFILVIINLLFIADDLISITSHFCHLIFFSVPLVYVGELFSSNVKALAIAIVTIFDILARFVIVTLPEFLVEDSKSLDLNRSYIGGIILLAAFPITFAFIPETKQKSFSDIQRELATTFHCSWLSKKLMSTERINNKVTLYRN